MRDGPAIEREGSAGRVTRDVEAKEGSMRVMNAILCVLFVI